MSERITVDITSERVLFLSRAGRIATVTEEDGHHITSEGHTYATRAEALGETLDRLIAEGEANEES